MAFIVIYKKYIEPFTAVLILIALIILSIQLYKDYQIKEQIKSNCGWSNEDYECMCRKADVNMLKHLNVDEEFLKNVSLDWSNSRESSG